MHAYFLGQHWEGLVRKFGAHTYKAPLAPVQGSAPRPLCVEFASLRCIPAWRLISTSAYMPTPPV